MVFSSDPLVRSQLSDRKRKTKGVGLDGIVPAGTNFRSELLKLKSSELWLVSTSLYARTCGSPRTEKRTDSLVKDKISHAVPVLASELIQ